VIGPEVATSGPDSEEETADESGGEYIDGDGTCSSVSIVGKCVRIGEMKSTIYLHHA